MLIMKKIDTNIFYDHARNQTSKGIIEQIIIQKPKNVVEYKVKSTGKHLGIAQNKQHTISKLIKCSFLVLVSFYNHPISGIKYNEPWKDKHRTLDGIIFPEKKENNASRISYGYQPNRKHFQLKKKCFFCSYIFIFLFCRSRGSILQWLTVLTGIGSRPLIAS